MPTATPRWPTSCQSIMVWRRGAIVDGSVMASDSG
jgi:hypothetical protein